MPHILQPRPLFATLTLAGLLCAAGCVNKQHADTPSSAASASSPADDDTLRFSHETRGAPEPGQTLFASPEEGAAVLKDAVRTKDRRMLIAIFGREGKQLVLTG